MPAKKTFKEIVGDKIGHFETAYRLQYSQWYIFIFDSDICVEGNISKYMTCLQFCLYDQGRVFSIEHIVSRSIEMGVAIPSEYNAYSIVRCAISFAKFLGCEAVEVHCKRQHMAYYSSLGFIEGENRGNKFKNMILIF